MQTTIKKFLTKVSKKVGKAITDYEMIENHDKILIGISGGKDSLTLVDVLHQKQKVVPIDFELFTAWIDFGFNKDQQNINEIKKYIESLGLQFYYIKKTLPETDKKFSCFWCSWNRRKELFLLADKLSCNKVALGHNLDDIVVTFLMNLFYHGEISTMPPKLKMFNGEIVLIRPLIYVTAQETQKYVEYKNLPLVENNCPYYTSDEKFQRRKYLTDLVNQLEKFWPNIKINIFKSLKRVKTEYLV